jgi:hypothetical protein
MLKKELNIFNEIEKKLDEWNTNFIGMIALPEILKLISDKEKKLLHDRIEGQATAILDIRKMIEPMKTPINPPTFFQPLVVTTTTTTVKVSILPSGNTK